MKSISFKFFLFLVVLVLLVVFTNAIFITPGTEALQSGHLSTASSSVCSVCEEIIKQCTCVGVTSPWSWQRPLSMMCDDDEVNPDYFDSFVDGNGHYHRDHRGHRGHRGQDSGYYEDDEYDNDPLFKSTSEEMRVASRRSSDEDDDDEEEHEDEHESEEDGANQDDRLGTMEQADDTMSVVTWNDGVYTTGDRHDPKFAVGYVESVVATTHGSEDDRISISQKSETGIMCVAPRETLFRWGWEGRSFELRPAPVHHHSQPQAQFQALIQKSEPVTAPVLAAALLASPSPSLSPPPSLPSSPPFANIADSPTLATNDSTFNQAVNTPSIPSSPDHGRELANAKRKHRNTFECVLCPNNRRFVVYRKQDIILHYISVHDLPKDTKAYPCTFSDCSKPFSADNPTHLKRHIRSVHSDQKEYECPVSWCPKKYNRPDNRRRHVEKSSDPEHKNWSFATDGSGMSTSS